MDRVQGSKNRRERLGGPGKNRAIDLDELHPGQQPMKSLSALRDFLIRQTLRDPQAVDRAETLDL